MLTGTREYERAERADSGGACVAETTDGLVAVIVGRFRHGDTDRVHCGWQQGLEAT